MPPDIAGSIKSSLFAEAVASPKTSHTSALCPLFLLCNKQFSLFNFFCLISSEIIYRIKQMFQQAQIAYKRGYEHEIWSDTHLQNSCCDLSYYRGSMYVLLLLS